jgi:hypothetical protein
MSAPKIAVNRRLSTAQRNRNRQSGSTPVISGGVSTAVLEPESRLECLVGDSAAEVNQPEGQRCS